MSIVHGHRKIYVNDVSSPHADRHQNARFFALCSEGWESDERDEFIAWLAEHPDAGDVIAATGGLRKVRWSRAGMGKRGGVRVIYMLRNAQRELVLLTVYAKAEHDILSPAFLRNLAQLYKESGHDQKPNWR